MKYIKLLTGLCILALFFISGCDNKDEDVKINVLQCNEELTDSLTQGLTAQDFTDEENPDVADVPSAKILSKTKSELSVSLIRWLNCSAEFSMDAYISESKSDTLNISMEITSDSRAKCMCVREVQFIYEDENNDLTLVKYLYDAASEMKIELSE